MNASFCVRAKDASANALFFAALLAAPALALATPVAMITDLGGAATLSEAGKARAAGLLAYLEPGTAIRLEGGARIVLTYFSKPVEVTLTGPAEATVGVDGVQVARGARPAQRSLGAANAETARKFETVQRERLALATVHMRSGARPQVVLDGPADTVVYTLAPVLAWTPIEGVRSYRLVVSDKSGRTHLDRTLESTSFALDKAPLKYGTAYEWRVEAQLPSGEPLGGKASFAVIDSAGARRLSAAKPAPKAPFSERLLFAARLESEGLAYDAKREWRALSAERPEDAALRTWAER